MNKVSDVARYMINCASRDGQPLSNLKLQKALYFLWKTYYKENESPLFEDDYFYAWKFGPVIPSVYYDYFMFGAYPIYPELLDEFDESVLPISVRSFINHELKKYENVSVAKLIDKTHTVNGAWDRVRKSKGIKEIIPYNEIVKDVRSGY